jgi:hypothetical protein
MSAAEELIEEGVEIPSEEAVENEKTVEAEESSKPQRKPHLSDEEFGTKVQKRINKEVAKRKGLEDTLAMQEMELKSIQEKLDALQNKQQSVEAERLEDSTRNLKSRYTEAMEEGDEDAANRILDEMADAKARAREIERSKKEDKPKNEPAKIHPAAQRFIDEHGDWLDDPDKHARLLELEEELLVDADGEKSAYLYKALAKKAEKEFSKPEEAEQEPASPVASSSRGGGHGKRGSGAITEEAKKAMTKYGLDPDKAEDRKAWLEARP